MWKGLGGGAAGQYSAPSLNSLEGGQKFNGIILQSRNSVSVPMLKKLKADSNIFILVLTAATYTGAKKPRPPKCSQTEEQIKNRQTSIEWEVTHLYPAQANLEDVALRRQASPQKDRFCQTPITGGTRTVKFMARK